MQRLSYAVIVTLLAACGGNERPGVTLENLNRILVDENGIEVINPQIEADSISFTARLTDPAMDAWSRAAKALGRQPVLAWATLAAQLSKDGESIGRYQFRLHQLSELNPDNSTILIRIPRQAARSHEERRPPPPPDTEISCRIWAVQID